jgi:DNA-binding PadR family transcriptional regulator
MSPRESLGEFEHLVLVTILRLDQDAYGVRIRQDIERLTGRVVNVGALYTTLDRLQRKGYVRYWTGEPLRVRGGRSRYYYELTSAGRAALRASRDLLTRVWKGVSLEPRRAKS